MLDLSVQRTKLTQGRSPAVMRLAPSSRSDAGCAARETPQASSDSAAQVVTAKTPAPVPEAAQVDPSVIADKVYELLRQERAIERQRRGLWY